MEFESFRLFLQRCDLATTTREHYGHIYKTIVDACPNLSQKEYEAFLSQRAVEVGTPLLNKYNAVMKKIVEWKKLDFPQSLLKKYKEHPKTRMTFSDTEQENFLNQHTTDDFDMFWKLCCYLGVRPGEAALLQVHMVDLSIGCISFPHSKTGTGRTIKLPAHLQTDLELYIAGRNGLVCSRADGKAIDPKCWLRDFGKRIERIGIKKKVTPYSFRHTLATKLLHNEASLFAVQDILGHTDPNTTRIYYHGNLKAQEKALNKDTLTRKHLGAKHLIKQIEEFINELNLSSEDDIDIVKVMEAKKLLWEAVK